nr:MAG TPA: Polynucleotide kinase [Caudoviricetes sp.]
MDMLPLLRMYKEQGFEIAYLTNRQRECWDSTAEQLEVFPRGQLFMRHMLDDTPPPEFKAREVFGLVCYADVSELVPKIYAINVAKFTCNQ